VITALEGRVPRIPASAFVAPTAIVVGDVVLGEDASVWYGAVLRGDIVGIRVGDRSNIQDHCVLHTSTGGPDAVVGSEVTVGHRAVIHGATVRDRCLIGMGAILLDGCVIGEESLVAAGSVVLQGLVVPPRSFVAGVPATIRGPIPPGELEGLKEAARIYVSLAREHAAAIAGTGGARS
jgi:carbonic anhydrase/acetyltransferase-like protein (isoleucine patch superfamily)